MKRFLFLLVATLVSFACLPVVASAQLPAPPGDPKQLFDLWTPALLSVVFVGLGYLSAFIPGLSKMPDTSMRVITFFLIAGAGMVIYGISFWQVAAAAFMSQGLYVYVFQWIVKTKKLDKVVTQSPYSKPIDTRTPEQIKEGLEAKRRKIEGDE
jgi:O-antigen/teichoic acid export membrane protein